MVGGAVRNTLLAEPLGDVDIATTATPERGDRPGRGGGLQGGADRHRARHHHRGRRRPPARGDHLARGRRDRRAPRQGRVRARLAARCRAPRLHHERALGRPRRHDLRLCRRPRRSRGAARALHRRAGDAHRRGPSAHPAVLPLSCRLWAGRARSGRPGGLHRGARASRPVVARAGADGDVQAPGRRPCGAGAGGHERSRPAALGARPACRCWRA